ncbi:MAG: nucleotide exchange factor GrpE [Anaerolineales bacterium]
MNEENLSEMENNPQETQETTPQESVEENLNNKIEELEKKANEYLDGWQRSRAEFANYKKRVEREQAQAYQMAAANIIKKFLEIADDLERALKNRPQDPEGAEWANGIELIYRKLLAMIEAEGVKMMDVSGQTFDPNLHEAVSHEEVPGYSEGEIIEVVKQGYLLGDRVLRPATVRVAR